MDPATAGDTFFAAASLRRFAAGPLQGTISLTHRAARPSILRRGCRRTEVAPSGHVSMNRRGLT